jgi:hypothetical protein
MKKIFILILISVGFVSCTDNEMARKYGGSETIKLPIGKKLVNITWKEDHLWLLTTDMKPGDSSQTYQFKEKSSWGIVEGTITIVETVDNQLKKDNLMIFEE